MTDRNKGLESLTCLVIVFTTQNLSALISISFACGGCCPRFPGAGAQEERVQREDDRGADLRGGEALPEGPAGGGQPAVHSVHRPAAAEGGGVGADAGTPGRRRTSDRSASVLMFLMVRAGHSVKLLTPLARSQEFL